MRRSALVVSALLLGLLLAGCGGDEDHPEGHDDSAETSQTTAAAGTETTEPGGGSDTSAASPGGGDHAHDSANFADADATDTAKISMRDFAYVDMPATVTGPRLRIEAKNNGPTAHEVLVFDADGNEIAGTDPVPSGETAKLSAELPAGSYQLRCLIEISATETHFDRGMRVTFAVM